MSINIPFRKTSKSYVIAKKLVSGKSISEIESEGTLRQSIHNVRNKMKKAGFAFDQETSETPKTPKKKIKISSIITAEPAEQKIITSPEPSVLESFKAEIIKSVTEIVRGVNQTGDENKKIKIDEGSLIKRTLLLTPKSLIFYDLAKAAGYPGSLSSYVNEMLTKFYEQRGAVLGFMEATRIG